MTQAETILAIISSIGVGAILRDVINSVLNRRKNQLDSNHSAVETSHTAVDTAGDALEEYRKATDARYAALVETAEELKRERDKLENQQIGDNRTIIKLNSMLGESMRDAETRSREILKLHAQVDELLCILKEHNIEPPTWAGQKQ